MQADAVKAVTLEGVDAVMTDVPKVCVSVSTADCIPILIYDRVHHAVVAVHAGWRGTVLRIVEAVLHAMSGAYGTRPQDVEAAIGPGISLEAFEVGDEVYEAFRTTGFPMEEMARRYPVAGDGSDRMRNGTLICGKPTGACWRIVVCPLHGFIWPECVLTAIPNVSSPHVAWASVRGAS